MNKRLLFPLLLVLALNAFAQPPPARIDVSPTVLRAATDLEPLGLDNLGDCGGLAASSGNLITQSGFEPVYLRSLYHVIEAGQDNGKRWVTLDGPGTSNYLLFTNGTFSGARMRAYRFLDASGQPLPYKESAKAQGGKVLDTTKVAEARPLFDGHVLPKGAPGFPDGGWLAPTPGITTFNEWHALPKEKKEEIQKGWRVYYDADVALQMDDLVIFERSMSWPDPAEFHPRVSEKGVISTWTAVTGQIRHVPLPTDAPKEMDGGQGAMEVAPANGVAEAWFKLFCATGRKDAIWYGTLDEGLTYRYEVWAKVDGAASGQLHLGFGADKPGDYAKGYFGRPVGKDFPVTGKWQKIGFEFTAPATPASGGIEGTILRYTGAGRLLVDNVKLQPVYQTGDADKPFVIYKKLFNELMSNQPTTGRKGALRAWNMLSQDSMESLLGWHRPTELKLTNTIKVEPNNSNPVTARVLQIAEATGNSPETRMVPWFITQVTHSEEEYRQLVEYLAAPYDPAKDSPQTKPLAYRRTMQRGNNRPWTDDFREIIIEVGNENWHNRMMPEWLGVGRFGTVHQGGREMGVFLKHLVQEMRKSPYWNKDKIKISFGGNYNAGVNPDDTVSGYGQEAVQTGGDTANYHSHATYVGPRWEVNEKGMTSIDDTGVQKTLLSYRTSLADKEWADQSAADQALRKLGFKVKMTAYEGGPSGFGLRAKTPEEDRAGEYYGKSYAMGTVMLDAWLDAWAKGWTYQCYFNYGQGKWWNSHTAMANGFRPSPGFQIQTIINHTLSNRDMLAVTVSGSPSLSAPNPQKGKKYKEVEAAPTKQVQTVHAHAFGDTNYVAVAVVNLGLANPQPIEIKLPLATAKKITLHTLTGGPRDTNMDAYIVKTESKAVEPSQLKNGVFSATIPAGSPAVFVFEK